MPSTVDVGRPTRALRVVLIGTSAGGIDALKVMMPELRPDGGTAYVLAQHMAANASEDVLVRLIERRAKLRALRAVDGTRLEADTVYVVPAGHDGRIERDRIRLDPAGDVDRSCPSLDTLFTSAALAWGPRALAVVLSGAGRDGAVGSSAVRDAGGRVVVQDPYDATHPGMPAAAIRQRAGDRVVPAERIYDEIAKWADAEAAQLPPEPPSGNAGTRRTEGDVVLPERLEELNAVLPLVQRGTGIDFSGYKVDTLVRRLASRKARLEIHDAASYLHRLERDAGEVRELGHHFLVPFTRFFRDRAAFDRLAAALREGAMTRRDRPYRVWVPACASGEEAFSIAMVLDDLGVDRYEVIGTDVDEASLEIARTGEYANAGFAEVEGALIDRYTEVASGGRRRVAEPLRERVRFDRVDVLSAAPPDAVDVVSCRNFLIYLKEDAQERVFERVADALVPGGVLFIGPFETLTPAARTHFDPIAREQGLYRRRSAAWDAQGTTEKP